MYGSKDQLYWLNAGGGWVEKKQIVAILAKQSQNKSRQNLRYIRVKSSEKRQKTNHPTV